MEYLIRERYPKKEKNESLKGNVKNLMEIYRDESDNHFFRAIASLTFFFKKKLLCSRFRVNLKLKSIVTLWSCHLFAPHGVTSKRHIEPH